MVWISVKICISNPLTSKVIAVNSIGKGWQSGITSLVFLAAKSPAVLDISKTFPFGTLLFSTASMVCSLLTCTTAVAIAFLSVLFLWVILTI